MWKALELPILSENLSLKGYVVDWNEKIISRDNHSQNIWDQLLLSCEIRHCEKSLISFSQQYLASINKIFTLARRLGIKLSFYKV